MAQVMIVEDERLLSWALSEQLRRAGHDVNAAADLASAKAHLEEHQPEVLLLDLSLPDGNGLDFYEGHLEQLEDTVVIVMTAVGQVEAAVRAMKLGALDFLSKPVDQQDLVKLIERSSRVRRHSHEVEAARQTRERYLSKELIAESPAFLEVLQLAEDVAESEVASILILGESGCGKNVLARFIHAASGRRKKPIIEVSCAAIPDQLLESELFGHERGAFTDAKVTRRGSFELAEGGSVVLDEIGDLKMEMQAKLLHVLEERTLRRVGGSREIHVDVRVIALTNRDLSAGVQEGRFRGDLFYRLSVFPITVPPLRDHPEDILPLAKHFVEMLQPKIGRRIEGLNREAENRLVAYGWPGNIRELRNVIERGMVVERKSHLTPASLILDSGPGLQSGAEKQAPSVSDLPFSSLAEMEETMVRRALRLAKGNQTRAAELLQITRDQLRYRLKKLESN